MSKGMRRARPPTMADRYQTVLVARAWQARKDDKKTPMSELAKQAMEKDTNRAQRRAAARLTRRRGR